MGLSHEHVGPEISAKNLKSINSPEPIQKVHFAMRYPVHSETFSVLLELFFHEKMNNQKSLSCDIFQ